MWLGPPSPILWCVCIVCRQSSVHGAQKGVYASLNAQRRLSLKCSRNEHAAAAFVSRLSRSSESVAVRFVPRCPFTLSFTVR